MKHLFFLGQEAKNNNQNSDWQWQALPAALSLIMTSSGGGKNKRVHARNTRSALGGGGRGGISGATQCKHDLLANKQSGLLFLFFFLRLHLFFLPLFTSPSVSEIPRRSDLTNCAAWHTSSNREAGKWRENKFWENTSPTFEFTLWLYIFLSQRSPPYLSPSVSITPSSSLPRYLCLFSSI